MYQTKKELRVKLKLAEQRIKTLEDRLQAARDVNYELRQDMTTLVPSSPNPQRQQPKTVGDGFLYQIQNPGGYFILETQNPMVRFPGWAEDGILNAGFRIYLNGIPVVGRRG